MKQLLQTHAKKTQPRGRHSKAFKIRMLQSFNFHAKSACIGNVFIPFIDQFTTR